MCSVPEGRCKPAAGGDDLQATYRGFIARGAGQLGDDGLASQAGLPRLILAFEPGQVHQHFLGSTLASQRGYGRKLGYGTGKNADR